MKWIIAAGVVSVLVTAGIAAVLWYQGEQKVFLQEVPLQIGDTQWSVRVADSQWEQSRGLQGVEVIGEHSGMVFVFDTAEVRSVWMKHTLVELDVVWIADGRVVGVTSGLMPEPGVPEERFTVYRSPQPIDSFVEIPGGQAAASGIAVGDSVLFTIP